ncbi:MAG: DUF4976 domain-containing protein [Planctomycetota bacterium]|nr:MAG: DUF4976 domain-containing protein [Planctomycetota bacterium]
MQPANSAERNIVLFVADDLGCDLGCYGNPVIRTPNIDAFASQAVLFRNAFATTASCSASRSVILSGLYNHANGQYGQKHSWHHFSSFDWVKSLPWFLSRGGYRTVRVGKYHVAPESVYQFDQSLGEFGRDVVQMVDAARPLFDPASTQPFFLYICTSDPHRGGGTVSQEPLAANRFGNPAGKPYRGIKEVEYAPEDVIVPPFLPDTPECRAELAQYYQSVSRVDQGFGYLVRTLQEAGVYEDTLILLISDHGIAMPGGKTTCYEPGLRSPCIVRLPGGRQGGSQTSAIINWTDLTPTLLDFAGLLDAETGTVRGDPIQMPTRPGGRPHPGTPYRFHGRSFLPVLHQPDIDGYDTTFASHTFHEIQMYYPMRVVRERRWKLIWNIAHPLPYPFASDLWAASTWQAQWQKGSGAMYGPRTVDQYIHRPKFELFDLQNDPNEAQNLADDPRHAETLERLKEKLRAFQEQTLDPWVLKWRYE